MKRVCGIFVAVTMAMVAHACSTSEEVEQAGEATLSKTTVTITASRGDAAEWSNSDKLSLFDANGNNANVMFELERSYGSSATFDGKISGHTASNTLYAVAPYSKNHSFEAGALKIAMSASQSVIFDSATGEVDATSSKATWYLAGRSNSTASSSVAMDMKSTTATIELELNVLSIASSTSIQKVIIEADAEIFPSSANISFGDDGEMVVVAGEELTNSVTLNLEGAKIANLLQAGGSTIVIPFTTFAEQIPAGDWTIDITTNDAEASSYRVEKSIESPIVLGAGVSERVSGIPSFVNMDALLELPFKEILHKYFDTEKLYIGAATTWSDVSNTTISNQIAEREFDYATPTNDFKQTAVYSEDSNNNFALDFTKPIIWENYSTQYEAQEGYPLWIRMHSPISPQCSDYVKDDARTAEELIPILEGYMTGLCQRYVDSPENIRWMDVVNETIVTSDIKASGDYPAMAQGEWFGPREGIDYWENPWTQIGYEQSTELEGEVPLYISMAFEIANTEAPRIVKIYNHHGDFDPVSWEKLKKTVAYLRNEKGQRVDGIGWQAHLDAEWEKDYPEYYAKYKETVAWAHENDLEFHITELNSYMSKLSSTYTDEQKQQAQADTFVAVLDVLLDNYGGDYAVGLNLWGVIDSGTGNETKMGAPWESDGSERTAVKAMKQALIDRIDFDDLKE